MTRRAVVALLRPVGAAPPGVNQEHWRRALAEDVVDLLTTLNEVEPVVAVTPEDRALAEAVIWPGTPVVEVATATVDAVLATLTGFDQVAVVAPDAPDLPGLVVGKLLRPLTTRQVAVAPAGDGQPGLLGLACRLPAPRWLPPIDLDRTEPRAVRAAAPAPGDIAVTPGWSRQLGPADLARLDPAVEGWEATRALLSTGRVAPTGV